MPTRDAANEPMALSLLANREVPTSSEEWRHECEIAYLASLPLAHRNRVLDGVVSPENRDDRGIKGVRGEAAIAQLRAEIDRYGRLKMA